MFARRRSLRLQDFDYRSTGAYFITICAEARRLHFEDPVLAGIVEKAWRSLPYRFPSVALDAFVLMPNHVHFVLWLTDVAATLAVAGGGGAGASPAPTLGQVVGAFKSIVAVEWLKWLKVHDSLRSGRVWQRNYYEHVVRNEDELHRIREYIVMNPVKWHLDHNNPAREIDPGFDQEWAWLEPKPVTGDQT